MYPNVRAEMSRKGISVTAMAEALGINITTMSLKLKGSYPFTFKEATIIKKVLEVTIPLEELFEEAS